ncbi:cell envelope integrity protein TolA [Dokdonella sp. MW10]|uniref:cell envelope integrity protein TolA n=1 Tax=Dokdonella sp. MW10 TaxID=2992926 RepID=UPI003F7CF40F
MAIVAMPCAGFAEEGGDGLASARTTYALAVRQAIQAHLVFLPGLEGTSCRVAIEQDDGLVTSIERIACDDAVLAAAVERAIRRASPLPRPGDARVSEPRIVLTLTVPASY